MLGMHSCPTSCESLRSVSLRIALLVLTVALRGRAAEDSVLWSDGRTWSGTVRMAGDARLPLHDGKRIRPVALAEIARIDWQVETQRMERAWTFVEAGRTEKRFEGEPYPVRHWKARIALRNGEVIPGHLISTVFYLEDDEGTSRLVVKSKQRGQPGESPDDLVAPVLVQFGAGAESAGDGPTVRRLRVAQAPAELSVGAASLHPTAALEVRQEGPGLFRFAMEGRRPVLALRSGLEVRVGWPAAQDAAAEAKLRVRVEAALPHVRDFFDERRLLAVLQDPDDPARGHSLMLLLREGRTTLGGAHPNPWHVEVWTWRLGEEEDRLLFEGRAVLARDRRASQDPLPNVVPDASLVVPEPWEADAGAADSRYRTVVFSADLP